MYLETKNPAGAMSMQDFLLLGDFDLYFSVRNLLYLSATVT